MLLAAIDLVSTMLEVAAQKLELALLSNDLLENQCMMLPSNLRSIFLQHLFKVESKYI